MLYLYSNMTTYLLCIFYDFFFFFHWDTVKVKHCVLVCVDWLWRSMGLFMEMNVTELESGGLGGPLLTGEI